MTNAEQMMPLPIESAMDSSRLLMESALGIEINRRATIITNPVQSSLIGSGMWIIKSASKIVGQMSGFLKIMS